MKDDFKNGYDFFQNNISAISGAFYGESFADERIGYINSIEEEINGLQQGLNAFEGFASSSKMLKGDVAEVWQAHTFNINAAINQSSNRAFVDRSHDFGSVDVSTNFGDKYGLKYYADAAGSAKQQAKSIFERYKEYQAQGGKDDLNKFMTDRQYDSDAVINDPIYAGQIRLIPSDQMKEATKWLKEMIAKESLRRPEQVKRYQETLDLLTDRIKDSDGNSSIPLSKEDAEKLASLAKEGKFNPEDYGIGAPDLLDAELLLKNSLNAGLNAAIISLALKVGPEIYKSIEELIQNGELDEDDFKNIGFAALSGSAEGFIKGSVASALTTCCKTGILGESLKQIDPGIISAVTVITMNTIKDAAKVAKGDISRTELANNLVKNVFLTSSAMTAGITMQALVPVPVLGYMIGSFVGSIAGSVIYNAGQQVNLSFCAETGITMFGLVEQNYELPKDVLEEIGVKTLDYETFELDTFTTDTFQYDTFNYDTFEPDNIGIKYLRRGVIGVSKIGYVE